MKIGQIIQQQIGSRAFSMMGAKNLMLLENGLQWKVGRNPRGIIHVMVTLDNSDTYSVGFYKYSRRDPKQIAVVHDVHVENLRTAIESNTGLYLSL